MKEHPIIFNSESVRAIRDGRKTMTRRVIKLKRFPYHGVFENGNFVDEEIVYKCPFNVGDRIWVRETYAIETNFDLFECDPPFKDGRPVKWEKYFDDRKYWNQPHYAASDPLPELVNEDCPFEKCAENGCCQHWTSPLFMPRWASRITLEITGIKVEMLQDITVEDCLKEGSYMPTDIDDEGGFINLWNSINAKRGYGWDKNPFVWAYEFKKI